MLVSEFGNITKKGWAKLEGVYNQEKLSQVLKEFSPLERIVVVEVLASNMRILVTCENALDLMKDLAERTRENE